MCSEGWRLEGVEKEENQDYQKFIEKSTLKKYWIVKTKPLKTEKKVIRSDEIN